MTKLSTPRCLVFLLLSLGVLSAPPAGAEDVRSGTITVQQPWARATAGEVGVAAGYMVVKNDGAAPDRLVAATAEVAGRVEIHEMSMKDNVMTMQALAAGLSLPPGTAVALKPGSYHLMLLDLKRSLKQGETFLGTLTFEKAGTVVVRFAVEAAGAAQPRHQHGSTAHPSNQPAMRAEDDREAIRTLAKLTWDRPEAPLAVAPISIEGDYAVAGWTQDKQGGRALLRRQAGDWSVQFCSGASLTETHTLRRLGVPDGIALRLAAAVRQAESGLPAATVRLFDSFDGEVDMSQGAAHPAHRH